eukprot:663782-Amorphochlora_amoeboformis.AAC.1
MLVGCGFVSEGAGGCKADGVGQGSPSGVRVGGGQAPPKDDVRKGGAQASHTPSGVSEMKGSQTYTKNITFHQVNAH